MKTPIPPSSARLLVPLVLALFAAQSASAKPIAEVELKNPHAEAIRGGVAVVPVGKLKIPADQIVEVVRGDVRIPAQLEDIKADGTAGNLVFLVDLDPGASARFGVETAATPAPSSVAATIGPAWESEKFGFRSYGVMVIDLFARQKGNYGLKLAKFFGPDNTPAVDYHKPGPDGMDILHINKTLGLAGVFATDGKTVASPQDLAITTRVLAAGPVRALVEMKLGPWESPWGQITFTRTASIAAGHFGTRIADAIEHDGKTPLEFGVGLRKEDGMARLDDPGHGTFVHRFIQDPAIGPAGIGLYFPAAQPRELTEDDNNRYFAVPSTKPLDAVAFGFWSGEEDRPIDDIAAARTGAVRGEQLSPEVVSVGAKAR